MRVGDITDIYDGHIVVMATTHNSRAILYDSRRSPDFPFDVCFMEVNALFPMAKNLLEVWVNV